MSEKFNSASPFSGSVFSEVNNTRFNLVRFSSLWKISLKSPLSSTLTDKQYAKKLSSPCRYIYYCWRPSMHKKAEGERRNKLHDSLCVSLRLHVCARIFPFRVLCMYVCVCVCGYFSFSAAEDQCAGGRRERISVRDRERIGASATGA